MQKYASVDFSLCRPGECDVEGGLCKAAEACTRSLLEQEDPFEIPALMSARLCCGCSRCIKACPLAAISISAGY